MAEKQTWEERVRGLARDAYQDGARNGWSASTHAKSAALLSDLKALEQRAEEAEAEVKRLREALAGVTDGEPCNIHQSGYCVTHSMKLRGGPCPMQVARKALAQQGEEEV